MPEVVKKVSWDKREYGKFTLTNGIKVLLVRDKDTLKAGVAIGMDIGSMTDPLDMPGCAHFLEHMICQGMTKTHPEEEDNLRTFLTDHGGNQFNGFTSTDNTIYQFSVSVEHLEKALLYVSCLFIDPVFSPSRIESESHAIQKEYMGNTTNDGWCLLSAERMINPDHPFCKFQCGNMYTLITNPRANGKNVQEELERFFNDYYSSNLMSVVVISKAPLEELKKIVISKFGSVKNKEVSIPRQPHIIRDVDTKTQVNVLHYFPSLDSNLRISWPMDSYSQCYPKKISQFTDERLRPGKPLDRTKPLCTHGHMD